MGLALGFLGKVLAFKRSTVSGEHVPEVTIDRDGDETATAGVFAPAGDDAPPLPGDVAYLGDDAGAGAAQALGYQDPATAPVAAPGERRLYSRSGPGVVAAEVWLKKDGAIVVTSAVAGTVLELGADGVARLENAGGAVAELGADGSASIANALGSVVVDPAGNVTATTPLGSFGAATHTHPTPFGPSGPPIPGT